MSNKVSERKSVRNLLDSELVDLRTAFEGIMNMRDNRGFANAAGYHGSPNWYCIHSLRHKVVTLRTRLFLPWHRAYLRDLELRLRQVIPTVTLPWWDWTSSASHQEGLPKAFLEQHVDGNPNPLSDFYINLPNIPNPIDRKTRRNTDPPNRLPTKNDVEKVLTASSYGEFCDQVEDLHDRIHVWVGGDMGRVATAAFDPIFWVHHCMVDRIWWIWQQEHKNINMPEEFKEIILPPFPWKVGALLNINNLGYEYVANSSSARGPTQ